MQINIYNLTKKYPGGKYALKDVNLQINPGMFGLLGPNGAGKTTLMCILVTLLAPSSGSIAIDHLDLKRHRAQIRCLIGYLPQNFANFPKFAVWEYLDYVAALAGLRRKKQRRERVDHLLETVGLFDVRDRMATHLSGGMKRRLGIAQSLVGEPAVLVVDEPTVGLDPEERLRFRNLLADLVRDDITILLSTHIVGDISSTCTDLAVLHQGEIVFKGPPEDLTNTANGKVWQVVADHDELSHLKEQYPVISTIPAGGSYEVRLVAANAPTPKAQVLAPNLEDAYIYYMQSIGQDMDLESEEAV